MTTEHGNNQTCPIARAARVLGDHWTLLIVRDLAGGCRRCHELQVSTGMSPSILSGRLRALEATGMVTRRQFSEIPPRVEYTLTEMGRAALPIVDLLGRFGAEWLAERDEIPPCREAAQR